MATIYKEFIIDAAPAKVWDALRDFGALHERLVRGFVTACSVTDGVRSIAFANGMTANETLVGIDEAQRRLSYASIGGRAAHHNASAQVFSHGDAQTRFVWITDVLPDAFAGPMGAMMDQGVLAMQATLKG